MANFEINKNARTINVFDKTYSLEDFLRNCEDLHEDAGNNVAVVKAGEIVTLERFGILQYITDTETDTVKIVYAEPTNDGGLDNMHQLHKFSCTLPIFTTASFLRHVVMYAPMDDGVANAINAFKVAEQAVLPLCSTHVELLGRQYTVEEFLHNCEKLHADRDLDRPLTDGEIDTLEQFGILQYIYSKEEATHTIAIAEPTEDGLDNIQPVMVVDKCCRKMSKRDLRDLLKLAAVFEKNASLQPLHDVLKQIVVAYDKVQSNN